LIGICFFWFELGCGIDRSLLFEKNARISFQKKGIFHLGEASFLFPEDHPAEIENAHFSLKKWYSLKVGIQETQSPDYEA
jgi:hypothetical protein